MAARTTAQKARAIATTAGWLADVLEKGDTVAVGSLIRSIEQAYSALRFISETHARNTVCGVLLGFTRVDPKGLNEGVDRCSFVRSFIKTIQDGDEYNVDCAPKEAPDETIIAALDAWARAPGHRKGSKHADKWEATAALLRASGFSRVEPSALRKSWDRRNK